MATEVMSREAYAALLEEAAEAYPKACPSCGSRRIQPTWLAPNEWDCGERDCLAVWTQEA